jgi:formate/nitrite transporter FocA (FNT family)
MPATKKPGEIFKDVVEDGQEELERASTGLAFSAFSAGLNISFGTVALAVAGALTGGIGLLAMTVYPIGFLLVILAKAQLFTENTVPPVAVALSDRSQIPNMLRLWGVILAFNILGAAAFAFVVFYGGILSPAALGVLLEHVAAEMEYGFLEMTLRAVFGGWLVALIVWLVIASRDSTSQIFLVWGPVFLIPFIGLVHCVAGSTEVLISVFADETSWGEYLGVFLLPATLGNIIGGIVLVTLLNYAQVTGSKAEL